MKIIIGIRKSSPKGGKVEQFEMIRAGSGNVNVIKNKVLRAIESNPEGNYEGTDEPVYDFYITDGARKSVSNSFALAGEIVGVTDDKTLIEFNMDENGNVMISKVESTTEGALPQQTTVNQLKRIRKQTKSVTIDDELSKLDKQGANIQFSRNPIDTGIESIQDYEKSNKNFNKKHTFKRIKPFADYQLPQTTSHKKSKK
jgi:hypothetical protein